MDMDWKKRHDSINRDRAFCDGVRDPILRERCER